MESLYNNTHSLSLDGTGDFLDTNYQTDSTFQGSFSVSAWIKLDDGRASSSQCIFGADANDGVTMFEFTVGTAGTLGIGHISNSDAALVYSTDNAFADGAMSDFAHVVAVVTKDSGSGDTTYAAYVDGTAVTLQSFFGISAANHAQFSISRDFYVGASNHNTVPKPCDGLIDEFSLWNKALSSSEVTSIYNSGSPTDLTGSSNLVLYYKFNNDATDATGTSDGTLAGDATFSTTTP